MDPRQDLRRKLTQNDLVKIIKMRARGMTYLSIANYFNVDKMTIYVRLNPDYYERKKERIRTYRKNRYNTDKKYRKRVLEIQRKSQMKRYYSSPEYRKYFVELIKQSQRRKNN